MLLLQHEGNNDRQVQQMIRNWLCAKFSFLSQSKPQTNYSKAWTFAYSHLNGLYIFDMPPHA